MSGKREASYNIDPHTLQQQEKDQQNNVTPINNYQAGLAVKNIIRQQRKIFKIKKQGETQISDKKQSKVTFKLNQSQQIVKIQLKKKCSDDSDKNVETKDSSKKQEPLNVFANLFKANENNVFNGLGIFSNSNSTNLFTSNIGTSETAKANANKATSIFAQNKSIGILPQNKAAGIFSQKGPSIFDNSIKNTSSSLFVKKQDNNQDDGSGDSAELQNAQKIQADPQKSTKSFAYDDSCPIILTLRVSKFKKSGGQLIENVEIVLQKQKLTNIKYITVRLPATKKNIFSGVLVEGRSQVKHLHGKKQNVQVSAFCKQKDSFTKSLLKFQFENPQDGEKLFQRLSELLNPTKQQNQQNKN